MVTLKAIALCDPAVNTATVQNALATDGTTVPTAQDSASINASPIADLAITKESTATTAIAGNLFGYTLTVVNNGPTEAENVVVTDTLPVSTTFVAASPGCAETSLGSGVITCTVGSLPTDVLSNTAVITLVVRVASGISAASIDNVAVVGSSTDDSNLSNNTATKSNPVQKQADLVAVKSAVPSPAVTAGSRITYTIVVTNAGPSSADPFVTIVDTIPSEVTPVVPPSAVHSGGQTVACSGGVCILAGEFAVGDRITMTIVGDVAANAVGVITNTVAAFSPTPDPNPNNNQSTITTTVEALAKLRIDKIDLIDPVGRNESLIYHIDVTNDGPSNAQNVIITDTLPLARYVTYQTVTPIAAPRIPTGTLTCSLGTVTAGDTVNILVTVLVGQQRAHGDDLIQLRDR